MQTEEDASEPATSPLPSPSSPPGVLGNQGPPSIPLSILLDFAVQKTYQELTILVDLSPKKSDTERKLSLLQFAMTARQLFIRILAVVKWTRSCTKFDECTAITCFLDQQASVYTESADRLCQMSREFLPLAGLSLLQVPAAVDVLCTGRYSRLPNCIKTLLIGDEPIAPKEQGCVLNRLNQVIENRLFSNMKLLPKAMRQFAVKNGMVTFHVPGEFEVTLTMLGQQPKTQWTLVKLKVLVTDSQLGGGEGDGDDDLLHPNQVNYLLHLLQSRLSADKTKHPINELYTVLHSFCLALQLDIVWYQAMQMIAEQNNENMAIDEYVQGQRLVISYWKEHVSAAGGVGGSKLSTDSAARDGAARVQLPVISHKLVICVSTTEPSQPLQVQHVPRADLVTLPCFIGGHHSNKLSLENLLADTVQRQVKYRLQQLKERVQHCLGVRCDIVGHLPALRIFLVDPCSVNEVLFVTINFFTGRFISDLRVLTRKIRPVGISRGPLSGRYNVGASGRRSVLSERHPVFDELDGLLNREAWFQLKDILLNVRTLIIMNRCARLAHQLPFCIVDRLTLNPAGSSSSSVLKLLTGHHLILRFTRYDSYFLILQFQQNDDGTVKILYYLFTKSAIDALPLLFPKLHPLGSTCESVIQVMEPVSLVQLDPLSIANGLQGPRPSFEQEASSQTDLEHVAELTLVATTCEQRIAFLLLIQALNAKGIVYHTADDVQEGCTFLYITGITKVTNMDKEVLDQFWNRVVSCCVWLFKDQHLSWNFEFIFSVPVRDIYSLDTGVNDEDRLKTAIVMRHFVHEDARKCVDDFLIKVRMFAELYDPVVRFVPFYHSPDGQRIVEVYIYSLDRLILGYGPSKAFMVTIQWRPDDRDFGMTFSVRHKPGCSLSPVSVSNPHILMQYCLQQMFSDKKNLAGLATLLHETLPALLALGQLPHLVVHGVTDSQSQTVGIGHLFSIVPFNVTTVHVVYKGCFCLEVVFLSSGFVRLCDRGTLALVPSQKQSAAPSSGYLPIIGFKAFLNLYVKRDKHQEIAVQGAKYSRFPYDYAEFTMGPLTERYIENAASSEDTEMNPDDWTPSVAPIIVTTTVLDRICAKCGSDSCPADRWCPLQKFLTSLAILNRLKEQKDAICQPGEVVVKTDHFSFKFWIEEKSLSQVVVKLTRNGAEAGGLMTFCSDDGLLLLEQYFSFAVSSSYHANAVLSFLKLLSTCSAVHQGLLESILALVSYQLGLCPEQGAVVWSVTLCFVVPSLELIASSFPVLLKSSMQPGNVAVVVNLQQKKMLFWLKFRRVDGTGQQFAFPFVFYGENNQLQLFKPTVSGAVQQHGPLLTPIENCLLRSVHDDQNLGGDCRFWRSIRDLLRLPELVVSGAPT